MSVLDQIRSALEQTTTRQFKQYVIGFFTGILLILAFIVFLYFSSIGNLKRRIDEMRKKREEVKNLLGRFEIVKFQKETVDATLAKDKEFKILDYFNKLNVEGLHKTREPDISSEELDNGYTEVKLYASFSNMNMQKLVELLDAIQQNERIDTKELEIYKTGEGSINVNLLIATLLPGHQVTKE